MLHLSKPPGTLEKKRSFVQEMCFMDAFIFVKQETDKSATLRLFMLYVTDGTFYGCR